MGEAVKCENLTREWGMKVIHGLRHLENIHVVNHSGQEYFGCDQNWYSSEWQQMSGCGPSTASTLLLYLQKSGRVDFPIHGLEQKDCKLLMENVWSHITPTQDGIYLVEQFCTGIQSFASSHRFSLDCQSLEIPESIELRPELADVVGFIACGLDQDCPIAFLNLSKGAVINLEEWHWVTIVALETDEKQDQVFVTIFDGDKSDKIDFKCWYQTTIDGGALIYLDHATP
jgi:hypothetical protein